MPGKKRFGVSVSEEVARDLDVLADKLSVDRSSIVEEALREYIHDHLYYLKPHRCQGVMVILGRVPHEKLLNIIEENRDIIHAYSHLHVSGQCIEFMVVSGPSDKIALLHKVLAEETGCTVRYMPVPMEKPSPR